MELNEFQDKAMSTRLPSAGPDYVRNGLIAEVGEYFGHLSKMQRDWEDWDAEKLNKNNALRRKEIGDILWFVAALAEDEGVSLEEVAQGVINKLQDRKERNVLQGSGDER